MGSKKDKKDRKQKTEKKSKKDKKSSKKSGKDRKHKNEREGSSNDESGLATILNTALFGNPKLMVDIPAIAKSLDDGEYVDVYSISHPFTRGVLGQLMKHLPVLYDAQNGYYKDSINTNVSEFIVQHLTKLQIIKEPRDLSMSESLASKNVVQKLLELLTTFPDLKDELGGLFATIIDGNAVQLESLDNEDIRDGLEDLFRAIGMENSAEGYALPEGRRSELVKEALEHLSGAFEAYASSVAVQQSSEKGTKNNQKVEFHSSSSSSESESGSDSSHSEAEHEAEDHQTRKLTHVSAAPATADEPSGLIGPAGPPEAPSEISEPSGPIKGPSMPTLKDLHAARALIDQQRRSGVHHTGEDAESSDDDGYGPQLCDTATARVLQAQMSAVPLGFTGVKVDAAFERAFEAENAGVNSRLRGEIYTGEAHKIEDENKREEWILNPGDSKLAACKFFSAFFYYYCIITYSFDMLGIFLSPYVRFRLFILHCFCSLQLSAARV